VRDIVNIIGNFLWFFWEFFSIRLLFATLFVPFNRLEDAPRSKFDPGQIAQAFLVTTLMRIIGALIRMFVILIGIFCILLTFVVGLGMLFIWLAAPCVVVALFALALVFLNM
jgi:hypothetical protein